MKKTGILIADDDPRVVELVQAYLEKEGFAVLVAADGDEAFDLASQRQPDLVVLDIMLPKQDGWAVCRRLREGSATADTPIIMLTSRGEEMDRVLGLELGADDYVTKPFSMKELLSRIKAIRRRQPAREEKIRQFKFAGMKVDFDKQVLTRKGETVDLSSCESELLRLLVMRRGEAVSRSTILTEVWGYDVPLDTRTIDNHIVRLRQKIEDDPHHPKHILTAHGVGYKFSQ